MDGVDVVGTEMVYEGYSTIRLVTARLPDGRRIKREVESHGRVVAVLPYNPVRKTVLLVRQLRLAVKLMGGGDDLLEPPAGMIDDGETAEDSVRREAMEEVGLRLGRLETVAATWPSPGVSDEEMTLFLAAYSDEDRVGVGGGLESEEEEIIISETPLSALKHLGADGVPIDMKLLTLVQALRLRRPDLFD